jgi:hypothetical protein
MGAYLRPMLPGLCHAFTFFYSMISSLPLRRFAAPVVLLTSLVACSEKSTPVAPSIPAGVVWTVDVDNYSTLNIQKTSTANTFEFAGSVTRSSTDSKGIDITFPKAVGTYAIPGSGASAVTAIYVVVGPTAGAGAGYVGTSGTLTVTKLTATNITGTFSFTGVDSHGGPGATKTISNGTFNIAL